MRSIFWKGLVVWLGASTATLCAEEVTWRKARLAAPVGANVTESSNESAPAEATNVTWGPPRATLGAPRVSRTAQQKAELRNERRVRRSPQANTSSAPSAPSTAIVPVSALNSRPQQVIGASTPLTQPVPVEVPWVARGQNEKEPSTPITPPRKLDPPRISEEIDGQQVGPAPLPMPGQEGVVQEGPALIIDQDAPFLDAAPGCPDGSCGLPCADGLCGILGGWFDCGQCAVCGDRLAPWYGSAEYLLWWTQGNDVPPLVTTSPPSSQGIIGFPGTRVILGDGELLDSQRNGGRFRLGRWFGPCQLWAWETSVFFLGEENAKYHFDSMTTPVLARPFFNPNGNVQFEGVPSPGNLAEIVAIPGALNGGIDVDARNNFWGIDTAFRRKGYDGCWWNCDLLTGFRYLHLNDELRIAETIIADPNATDPRFAGFAGVIQDEFRTTNDFYGGQLGFDSNLYWGRWSLNFRTTVSLGSTHQRLRINGSQMFSRPGQGLTQVQGGLLAIPGANIGEFSRDRFSVVPEVGINIGYQLTPHLRCFVGYNFLYWSEVLRAGDQIDTVVDAARVPTFAPAGATPLPFVRPTVPWHSTDFWAQGINFGMELIW